MLNISRWQVFEAGNGDVVICKKCEAAIISFNGKAPEKLPRICPHCGAIMLGRTCLFPPKE